MKTATLILGVNGAGKTTFYKEVLKEEFEKNNTLFISADEIKISLQKDGMENNTAKHKSGVVAVSRMFDCMKENKSFAFETTFTDIGAMGSVEIIKELKKDGYKIDGHFIHTNDLNINIKNVGQRFKDKTGHYIPEKIIRGRYDVCIKNIEENGKLFNELHYYDNSKKDFKKLAVTYDKNIKNIEKLYNKETPTKKPFKKSIKPKEQERDIER